MRATMPSTCAGEAVDDAASGSPRPSPCRSPRAAATRSIRGSFAAARGQRVDRDLDARGDDAAEVLALGRDDVVVDGGAEVDRDARAAEPVVGGDRVDQPVGAELARVVDADRHAGPQARADGQHLVAEVARGHRDPLGLELRAPWTRRSRRQVAEADAAQLEQVAQRGAELVGGRVAHGREAPVLDELVVAVRPEVGLGVADVDDQQHRRGSIAGAAGGCGPRTRRISAMNARLYVVNGSHPCATVERALQLKHIPYKITEFPPPMHAAIMKLRFGARTVPLLKLDGEAISGSRAILAKLDAVVPEPALYPSDPDARAKVLEAERWGDEDLQTLTRRILWPTFKANPAAMATFSAGSKLPAIPVPVLKADRAGGDADRDEAQRGDAGHLRPGRALASRGLRQGRRAGSPRACSAARTPTRRTCRSRRACAC